MQRSLLVLILFVSTALASCASQSASSGGNEDKIGCKLDGERICQGALTAPLSTGTGITTSNESYLQQNTPVTTWVMMPLKAPGGSEIDVNCEVNLAQKKVIYANPTPSGTVSDSDRQWLQNTGWCIGSTATEAPPKLSGQE
jgi:hypothetical protein